MTLLRHPRRVWQVMVVLARFFAAPRLRLGRYADVAGSVRVRLALEELGGAWVKLGQMLAMRLDLLPLAYCDELFKLLNQMEPFPYEQVRTIVQQELGDAPETIYASFDPGSFAAASIGQVHRATLHSGERVAVKVQRPGIRGAFQADIELMYALARVLDRTHLGGATRSRDVIDEFARWTADELDYMVEARQAIQMHEHALGERLERIARVYRQYTTPRVLTTELIEGIPLIDIIIASRDGDTAFLDTLSARGHDLERIVLHLDWNMLNQVYVFGYFHADLHPANLYVLPDDVIGYVDFGIVGKLPDRVRESLTRYSRLLYDGNVEAAIEELMRWLAPTAATDAAAARWQLIRAHDAFLYDTTTARSAGTSADAGSRPDGRDNPYLRLAVDIMKTIREHELTLSVSVVSYLRMLVTLGTLRHQLSPHYDLGPSVRRFFRRLIRQQTVAWLDPRLSFEHIQTASARLQRATEFVEFLETQEPALRAASASLLGVRSRVDAARRRLVRLGLAALAVGTLLYVALTDPEGTQAMMPFGLPQVWLHASLLVALVILLLALVRHVRRFARSG
ncbi:MAG: ABC1 kinase family protein [Chloroflexota bacterium]